MGSYNIVMIVGVPLGVGGVRVRIPKEGKSESETSKEGLISLILGSGGVVPGW